MVPKRIRIQSFRSFTDEACFEFPQGPGLFYLTGRNEAEPRLGANGAGKTTLWEAWHWLYFGKTVTGLSAGQIAPWSGAKGTRVEYDYDYDDQPYTLGRTWSPNRWYLLHPDGHEELLTQDESNLAMDHLGMVQGPFLSTILMAQGEGMFFDLKPEAATTLFSQVLNLDKWLDHSTRARTLASDADKEARGLESALARVEGKLSAVVTSALPYTREEWESKREARLDELEKEYAGVLESLKKSKEALDKANADMDVVSADLASIAAKRRKLDDRFDREVGQGSKALEALRWSQLKSIDTLEGRIQKVSGNEAACPTCGHELEAPERREILSDLKAELRAAEVALADIEEELSEVQKAESTLGAEKSVLDAQHRDTQHAMSEARTSSQLCEQKVRSLRSVLDRIEAEVDRVDAEVNPVDAMEAQSRKERTSLEAERAAVSCDLAAAARNHRLYSFWVAGFKDIRLAQVTEALTELEIEVNSCINQLGLVGWKILLKTDTETKSAGTKRGFSVEVISPRNPKPVPWKSWSGGESQRLRVAGNMGLANLIRNRMGISLGVEVWDEPTQFLSPQGVTDLLDALSVRASEESRQIWVVDHRSLGYGAFDGVYTVVKTKTGSSFERSSV